LHRGTLTIDCGAIGHTSMLAHGWVVVNRATMVVGTKEHGVGWTTIRSSSHLDQIGRNVSPANDLK